MGLLETIGRSGVDHIAYRGDCGVAILQQDSAFFTIVIIHLAAIRSTYSLEARLTIQEMRLLNADWIKSLLTLRSWTLSKIQEL